MTTPLGQEPQPNPARGGQPRPAPRGAGSGWPATGQDTRGPGQNRGGQSGQGRGGYPPRGGPPWENERGPGTSGRGSRDRLDGNDRFDGSDRSARHGRRPAGAPGSDGPQAGPPPRWVGAMSPRTAIFVLLAATLIGFIGTVLTRHQPGFLLGFCVIAGSIVAALGIRRDAVYLIFPLPALAIFIAAVLAGAIHDRGIDTSRVELGASFLEWTASVFFSMCAATILVVVIGGARWLLSRQLVSGQFAPAAGRPNDRGSRAVPPPGHGAGRDPRNVRNNNPWGTADPRSDGNGPGGQRANRDPRNPRDPWDDRRPPAGSNPPRGNRPGGPNPPGGRGTPPDRDPWSQHSQRDDRGPGNQPPRRDQRPPQDPWGQR
jgi:hypothetical protein